MEFKYLVDHKRLFFPATAGLILFVVFQLVKPAYYHVRQEELMQNLRAQIYILQKTATGNPEKIKAVSEAKKTIAGINKNSQHLSAEVLSYEKIYLVLESLNQYYNYRQELGDLLPKILKYDPENDLNSRSVSENKGDFMYRLSLAQYALKQIKIRLEKHDDNPELADYTKKITGKFIPVVGLIDRLIGATNKDQIKTSNQLRAQYVKGMKQLQSDLKPLFEQISKELDKKNQELILELKI